MTDPLPAACRRYCHRHHDALLASPTQCLLNGDETRVGGETPSFRYRDIVDPLHAFDEAVAFHNRGRLREAEQRFEIVLKADGRHFGALYRLGLIRLQQGRFGDAVDLFRRAIKIDRRSADAQLHLAVALTGVKRYDDAIRHCEKALAIRPAFPEAYNNFGYTLQLLGRTDEAVAQYQKALATWPDYAEAHNNLGNALQKLKRFEEAIAEYKKVLTIRPNDVIAYANLGNALAGLDRHEEAITQYQKALAIKPGYVHAHHSMGVAFGMIDRLEEAIAQFERALQSGPDYAEAHFEIANALSALHRYEEAIIEYDKAIALKPHYIEALTAHGNMLIRVGRDAEGAEALNNLVRGGVRSINTLFALSAVPIHVKIDLLSELDKVISAGTIDDASDDKAAFVRAAALDKLGRHAEAWECLKVANRRAFLASQEELGTQLANEIARQRITLDRLRNRPIAATVDRIEHHVTSLFILGPSRSGKTILERLVSMLPGVKRGYEAPCAISDAIRHTLEANGLPLDTQFEDLPAALHASCRHAYADQALRRDGSATIVTNTMPGRIYTADLIANVFPNVRFLCVKRNIEDTILRIYQRMYQRGNGYAYDLKTARDYVVWYHQAIDLLCEKLPQLVRVIWYEDMVAAPAGALRIAEDLCGVPMTDGSLPLVGDDRGCAAPYSRFMAAELAA